MRRIIFKSLAVITLIAIIASAWVCAGEWPSERRLDFCAAFCLDRSVPAVDNGASQRAISQSIQNGAVAFATTHWSVVLAAQGESPAALEALEALCRGYWRPIYSFVRRHGAGPEEAEDLTQGFFALLLERRDLDVVRREKGRLRSYLLVSLKHFLANERHRAMAVKRGEGRRLVPLEELRSGEHADLEPADTLSPDRIYERRWALTVLEQVFARLKNEYGAAENARLFDCLKELLAGESGQPSQAKIAGELGMTENAVKQAFHRFRQRYQLLLREEIAHTVAVPGDIEDELRHLIAVLRE
ncbi:MAG: sigma-70 family RNA polymerase sigma factor [Chthoniobacterales bacterium]